MKPRIIALFNQKGGSAKTSSTVNLGAGLAKLGKKVLLVDLDQQGSLSYYLAIQSKQTVVDFLQGDLLVEQVVVEREGMYVLPSNIKLMDWEWAARTNGQKVYLLKERIKDLSYDFILLDCPPSVGLPSLSALAAAKGLIAPMPLDVMALHGLNQLMATVKKVQQQHNPALTLMGVLFTMVDSSKEITREIFELFHKKVSLPVFQSIINVDVAALEAPSFGKSVIAYAPSSISSIEYQYLAKEVLNFNDSFWLN
jgi:chromosome partitioning protein